MLSARRRLSAFAALTFAGVLLTMFTATSRADPLPVTFQGEVDSDGPLVIEPSATDDPRTLGITSYTSVYYIERMPQTKSVTSITLGDFGQGSCSSPSPTAALQVIDLADHDLGGASSQIAFTNDVDLPQTPGRMTWTLDWVAGGGTTLVLKAGHSYDFMLSVSGCSTVDQTTWAPLDAKFETPNRTCLSALPFGSQGLVGSRLQWHDSLTTPSPSCVNFLLSWWPYEPDGWLVSISPGVSYIAAIQNIDRTPYEAGHPPCDESNWADAGITQHNVTVPNASGLPELEGICGWDHYYPPGQPTRYGWSTALPLMPEFDGAPRLPYVRFDTVDWDNTLLQQYAPALKFDSGEDYLPEAVDGITSVALVPPGCSNDANSLNHRAGSGDPDVRYATAASSACPSSSSFSLNGLQAGGASYPYLDPDKDDGSTAQIADDDYIDLRNESYAADSAAIYSEPGWANHAYGRAYQGVDGELWLQYFFWYYYNDGRSAVSGVDDHEGDWEGIQLRIPNPLATNVVPDIATYNEHSFRSTCDWGYVEKADGHPVVYVSRGRHGSYFTPDKMPSQNASSADGTDASDVTPSAQVTVQPISSYTPNWVRWPGLWGASTGDALKIGRSPTGPATFPDWSDPTSWSDENPVDGKRSDIACPESPPVSHAARSRTRATRIHDTSGNGPAPELRWKRAGSKAVRVAWALPGSTRGRRATKLELYTHATSALSPAVTRWLVVAGRRHGVTRLRLPTLPSGYELVGRVLWADNSLSRESTSRIPAR